MAQPDDPCRRRGGWAWRGVALVAALLLFAGGAAPAAADPPPPQQKPPTGNAALDNVYYGAEPPGSGARPVLLFVHGLGGIASDWWLRHDMYLTAYNAGYRTAFVSLNANGQRGPSSTQWVNGRILPVQIAAVAQRYGVATVDIVGHSKGGVDAQTAIAFFGAAPRVRNVFMLGTPNHGTPLADLPLTTWLLVLLDSLGIKQDGALFALRTDLMGQYRAVTDPVAATQPVRYYTGAGTGGRPGSYLTTRFGPNDGLVTVAGTALPGATSLGTGPYDHYQLMDGHKTFGWIRAVLEAGSATVRAATVDAPPRPAGPALSVGAGRAP